MSIGKVYFLHLLSSCPCQKTICQTWCSFIFDFLWLGLNYDQKMALEDDERIAKPSLIGSNG
ncbi:MULTISPECIES: hypothetical protein [Dolichospermum]|uniref:Uncharacterized protein n=1 Tax=Dolichospermum heterosporum TAC447 TaxID=747523 RepID=A0ABY5LZ72_9CYAN|nr:MULTISPECIES: hypothetical protein [Dolichospermum]UUO15930.1 hypothetical protein NG743_02415 [Dolichospermum heterosporum TAC447]